MARGLMLLPARDFDPGEAAVSWQILSTAGQPSPDFAETVVALLK